MFFYDFCWKNIWLPKITLIGLNVEYVLLLSYFKAKIYFKLSHTKLQETQVRSCFALTDRQTDRSTYEVKGKAVLLQAWNSPEYSRKLRFPDCHYMLLMYPSRCKFSSTASSSCICVKNDCHRVKTQSQLNKYYYYLMTTAQDGGKVVCLTHRPSLPLRNAPGTHFC